MVYMNIITQNREKFLGIFHHFQIFSCYNIKAEIQIGYGLHGADDLEFPPHFFLFRVIISLFQHLG